MKKINFENGTTIDGATTFNQMQNNVEEVFNGKEAMGSIVVEDVVSKNLADIDDFIVDGKGTTSALMGAKYIYNLKPNTTYTLSFIKTRISGVSISNTTIYNVSKIVFYNGGTKIDTVGGSTASLASGASKSFSISITTPDNCDNIRVYFFNNNGDTNANTKVSKVQLEPGPIATDFVKFKKYCYNSQESMGKIIVDDIECKNLLNVSFAQTGEYSGVNISYSDGHLILNGTSTDIIDIYLVSSGRNASLLSYLNKKQGTYTLSNNLGLGNFTRATSGYKQNTIAITDSNQLQAMFVRIPKGQTYNNTILEIQLEPGDKVSPYIPHKEFSNKHIYSTQEQIVGIWHDGSTLYEKTILAKPSIASSEYATANIPHGISNFKFATKTEITAHDDSYKKTYIIPGAETAKSSYGVQEVNTRDIVVYSKNGGWNGWTWEITLRYTKTTDTSSVSTLALEEEVE